MKIYDISMQIFYEMPVYKGKESKRPILEVQSDFASGSVYESQITMNLHTGTHMDSDLHMIEGGTTIDTMPLEKVVTPCKVFDFTDVSDRITKEDLEKKPITEGDFILLKTKNSLEDILEDDFIFVDQTAAAYLRDKKIKGVGIDALGIERSQPGHETHVILFKAECVILEGLRLKDVPEGDYLLFAAPIYIRDAEAAPVRAVLVK